MLHVGRVNFYPEEMERPRPPTVAPLTKGLIQQVGLLQQQQQRGARPVNTTTSKAAAQAGHGILRPILPQSGKSACSVPKQGQGAAAVNSVEQGNQRHKGQESRAVISVQVLLITIRVPPMTPGLPRLCQSQCTHIQGENSKLQQTECDCYEISPQLYP